MCCFSSPYQRTYTSLCLSLSLSLIFCFGNRCGAPRSTMSSFVLLALIVLCTTANLALVNGDIALDYTSEIVLKNAVLNATFSITSEFTSGIAGILQDSLGASALSAQVYNAYPHLVISSEVWYTGSTTQVETSVHAIDTTYQKLASDSSLAEDVSGKLSYLCMRNIGQQPTIVDYSESCSFFNQTIPPSTDGTMCLRNLTVSIYTNSSDTTAMRSALCNFLPTDCDLITSATASQVIVPLNGTSTTVYLMNFIITSQDREATLALLVAYANYASFLVERKIVYILVDGVRVFYQGDMQLHTTIGTMSKCVQRMWYLIFLIILVPVILIISQQMFYWGRRSGKRSVKTAEADIRAGVQRNLTPWSNFGMSGYQYGPPQRYAGGYGGTEMQQQQDYPFMQQFYGQNWGGPQQFGGPAPQQPQQQYGAPQSPQMQNQFGNPLQQQPQQQASPPLQFNPLPQSQQGSLINRNAPWSFNSQQRQANPGQWGGYGAGGAQAGWGQQQ